MPERPSDWYARDEFAGIGADALALWWALISFCQSTRNSGHVDVGIMASLCVKLGIKLEPAVRGLYRVGAAELDAERQQVIVNGIPIVPTAAVKPVVENPETYTVSQVASRLGVHVETIYEQLRSGRMQGFRVGRKWLVPRSALESLLDSVDKRSGNW